MKEDLISFKTAKLAKEKGFNLNTRGVFENGYLHKNIYVTYLVDWNFCDIAKSKNRFSAPTQSLLQKWLREEHKIYAYIDWHDCSSVLFKDGLPEYVEVFEHMDLEKLLQEALKLIK